MLGERPSSFAADKNIDPVMENEIAAGPRLLFVYLWIGFWLLMVISAMQEHLAYGGQRYWEPVVLELTSAGFFTVTFLFLHRRLLRNDHLLHRPLTWFGAGLIWLPPLCLGFVGLVYPLRQVIYDQLGERYYHLSWPRVFAREGFRIALFYALWLGIFFSIRVYRRMLIEARRREMGQTALRAMQVGVLSRQLQPHFLFNALNLISAIMHESVAKADRLLHQLSELLRRCVSLSDRPEVSLAEELELLHCYAGIMEARFEGRVLIRWEIDAGLERCKVPTLITQPLLENVFKHSVEPSSDLTRVIIRAGRIGNRLRLAIEQDRGTLRPGPAGQGLALVRQRLAAYADGQSELDLLPLNPEGVCAVMTIPCVS